MVWCSRNSNGENDEHSYFPLLTNSNIPEDDSWKHYDHHISEYVDHSVRIIYDVLCSIDQLLLIIVSTRFT